MHMKSILTDEVIAEITSSGYVHVLVRFVTDIISPELRRVNEVLEQEPTATEQGKNALLSRGSSTYGAFATCGSSQGSLTDITLADAAFAQFRLRLASTASGIAVDEPSCRSEETEVEVSNALMRARLSSLERRNAAAPLRCTSAVDGERGAQEGGCSQCISSSMGGSPGIAQLLRDIERVVMCIAHLATMILDSDLLAAFNTIAPLVFGKLLSPQSLMYNKVQTLPHNRASRALTQLVTRCAGMLSLLPLAAAWAQYRSRSHFRRAFLE